MPISQDRLITLLDEYDHLWADFHQFLSEVQMDMENCQGQPELLELELRQTLAHTRMVRGTMVEVERRHFLRYEKANESARKRQQRIRAGKLEPSHRRQTQVSMVERMQGLQPKVKRVNTDPGEMRPEDYEAVRAPPQELDEEFFNGIVKGRG